ncbi:MAG: phosphotransferase [Bacteriovoracaceae bacterium]|nr:phosphotransferase [Bacteriovoracaceae bacterium]
MKPEQAEQFFVESLFKKTLGKSKIPNCALTEVEKLTGDASTRRYYRVETNHDDYVVCLTDPILNDSSTSPFIQVHKALADNFVRVPIIHDSILEKGYLLEEDLGDITLLHRLAEVETVDDELELYKQSVDELLKIHAIDPKKYSQEIFTKLAFDEEKLMSEVLFSIKFFIKRFLGKDITLNDEATIVSGFLDICRNIEGQHRVLTHRDYHSRNIMIKNNEQIVIDFQDARMGIPQYDLVSLVEDCYYELDRNNVEIIKRYYWDNCKCRENFENNYKRFLYFYDLMAMQRIFKAIGSFGFIYAGREDVRYVKYIGYGIEKLRTILLKHKEYSELRKTLSRIYYAN